jgi:hypothetical protein
MQLSNLVYAVVVCGACGGRTAARSTEPLVAAPPVVVQAVDGEREIQTCVVENGALRVVSAAIDRSTGDTLVDGRAFRDVFADTAGYAADRPWFINNEPITWDRRVYTKFGPPRIVSPSQLRRGGEHDGVMFFIEANAGATPEVIFVPTRPGCEFHRYQWERTTGGVRG